MTTDAKIGLLLALVFIVAITFVINGLPDFLSKKDKAQDTETYVSHYKPVEPGIIGNSRNIAVALDRKPASAPVTVSAEQINTQPQQQEANYQAILPAASEVVKSVSTDTQTQTTVIDAPAKSVADSPAIIYEVSKGDSLAEIARKFYGPKEGNRLANIRGIYEANKKTLKSMNDLQVGQKLIIPVINEREKALLKTGMFEKVYETKQTVKPAEPVSSQTQREYVIKENDSLWQIAAKYLGDGSRYEEIMELNRNIDPDNLIVGKKIKLPAK